MKITILLLLITVVYGCCTEVYTFYDDVGTLITVEQPSKCETEPAIIPMWKNATMTCPQKVDNNAMVGFMQPLMYFPYIRMYMCYLNDNHYYIVSNCEHSSIAGR